MKTLSTRHPNPNRVAFAHKLWANLEPSVVTTWNWKLNIKLQHTEVFEWFTMSVVSRSVQCQRLFRRLGWFLPYRTYFLTETPESIKQPLDSILLRVLPLVFPINLSLCLVKCHSAPFASIHPEHRRAGSCARPPSRLHFLSKFETVAKFMFVPLQVCGGPPPPLPPLTLLLPTHHPAHHQEQTTVPVLPPGHSAEKVTT